MEAPFGLSLFDTRLPQVAHSQAGAQVTLSVPGFSGCTIYYTTDGSCPSQAKVGQATFVYSTAFTVFTGTTVKTFATRSDRPDSDVVEFVISY